MGINSNGKIAPYVMDDIHSMQIDSQDDFRTLESLYKQTKWE